VLNRNRRLLLWWSQQKKDYKLKLQLNVCSITDPCLGGGGMAPWPPLDPPVPLSVLRLRLIRIFVCVVICVIH